MNTLAIASIHSKAVGFPRKSPNLGADMLNSSKAPARTPDGTCVRPCLSEICLDPHVPMLSNRRSLTLTHTAIGLTWGLIKRMTIGWKTTKLIFPERLNHLHPGAKGVLINNCCHVFGIVALDPPKSRARFDRSCLNSCFPCLRTPRLRVAENVLVVFSSLFERRGLSQHSRALNMATVLFTS